MAFLYAPGNLRKPRKTILAVFYGSLLRINQKLTIASSLAALKNILMPYMAIVTKNKIIIFWAQILDQKYQFFAYRSIFRL